MRSPAMKNKLANNNQDIARPSPRDRRLVGHGVNDHPKIRAIFDRFAMEEVSLNYTASGGKGSPAKELVIPTPIIDSSCPHARSNERQRPLKGRRCLRAEKRTLARL